MVKINSEFEIDKNGITVCRAHSEIDSNSLNYTGNIKTFNSMRIHLLPGLYKFCKTCDYYLTNECFFPKNEIDKVYKRRGLLLGQFFNKHKCDLCGHQIRNIFIILKKKFIEEKTDKKSLSICTSCQISINDGSLRSKMRSFLMFSLVWMLLINGIGIPIIIRSFLISTNLPQLMWTIAFTAMITIITLIMVKRSTKYYNYKNKI